MSELKYNFYCPNERYEYMARLFYLRKGMMAPGKDDVLSTHSREIKEKEWVEFMEEYYAEAAQAHFDKSKLENKDK